MNEKFNQWLINKAKEAHSSFNKREDLGSVLFFITTIFIIITLEIFGNNLASQAGSTLIEVFLLASLLMTMNNTPLTTSQAFGCWAHYVILYNKKQRQRIIDDFVNAFEREKYIIIEKECFLGMEKFNSLSKNNLDSWSKLYIGKQKSILKLVTERALGVKEFRTGILYWSQLIPRNRLSIDCFKLLLLVNPIKSKDSLLILDPIDCEDIENCFSGYSEADIKRIFTSSFYLKHYLEILNIVKSVNIKLPVKKDMLELLFWCKEISASIKGEEFIFKRTAPWISDLEDSETSLGEIVFIDNAAKLEYWAIAMNNCLKTQKPYSLRAESFIFGVYRDGKPYMVFQLHHTGYIREAKKKANHSLQEFESRALNDLLNEVVHKIRNN